MIGSNLRATSPTRVRCLNNSGFQPHRQTEQTSRTLWFTLCGGCNRGPGVRWMSRGRRRPDAAAGEQGFTLIEVIVSIVLLTLITGGISAALVTSINATKGSEQRTKGTNDAQIVAAFLNKDAQAAGGTDPSTGVADPSLGVKTPGNYHRERSDRMRLDRKPRRAVQVDRPSAGSHHPHRQLLGCTRDRAAAPDDLRRRRRPDTANACERDRCHGFASVAIRLVRRGRRCNLPNLPEHGEHALDREQLVPSHRDAVHLYAHGHAPTSGGREPDLTTPTAAHPLRGAATARPARPDSTSAAVRPSPCTARPTSTPRTAPGATQ